ncbi:MAG: matrixin family metalloprotease [Candidatus Moraniibacteriota bacterium]|nr:MAG: matrixin family metalloprotease [Candidatus Moranbacteria bacterium]
MHRIVVWILICIVSIGALYAFESARVPCRSPLGYGIGQFDGRFDITPDEFRMALAEAEEPWERALGRELFQYRDKALFPVNLIFDERQQRTIDGKNLEDELADVTAMQTSIREKYAAAADTLSARRKEYDAMLARFEQDLERYNRRVADWNGSDRTDEDELEWLRKEERRLDRTSAELETLRGKVNALVAIVNRYAKEEEKVVDRYNAEVETFAETYGTGEAFDQGVYDGQGIDIYQFDDREHLVMVLTHELGHALGLEHVANPKSIMYPVLGEQDLGELALSAEDRAALEAVCSVTVIDLLVRDARQAWLGLF